MQLYPVYLDDARDMYYMVVVNAMPDCLDETASGVFKDHKGFIYHVYEQAFKRDILTILICLNCLMVYTACHVNNRIRNRVVGSGLKG